MVFEQTFFSGLIKSTLQAIGAINCMIRRPTDGRLIGYNEDYHGAIAAIEDGLRGFHCILKAIQYFIWTVIS